MHHRKKNELAGCREIFVRRFNAEKLVTFPSGMSMLYCCMYVLQVMLFVSHCICSYFVLAG